KDRSRRRPRRERCQAEARSDGANAWRGDLRQGGARTTWVRRARLTRLRRRPRGRCARGGRGPGRSAIPEGPRNGTEPEAQLASESEHKRKESRAAGGRAREARG